MARVIPESLDVTGYFGGLWTPRSQSLVSWTAPPETVSTGQTGTAGTVYLSALPIPRSVSITQIYWGNNGAGATATAGANWIGLYSSAGVLLTSVGVDAKVTTTDLVQDTTFSSVTLSAGLIWVAFLFNASTMPSIYRNNFLSGNLINAGISSASGYRYATNGTGRTTLASSITPSSNAKAQYSYWCAIK